MQNGVVPPIQVGGSRRVRPQSAGARSIDLNSSSLRWRS